MRAAGRGFTGSFTSRVGDVLVVGCPLLRGRARGVLWAFGPVLGGLWWSLLLCAGAMPIVALSRVVV